MPENTLRGPKCTGEEYVSERDIVRTVQACD